MKTLTIKLRNGQTLVKEFNTYEEADVFLYGYVFQNDDYIMGTPTIK